MQYTLCIAHRAKTSENDNATEIILSRLHLEVRHKLGRPVARDVDVLLAISAKEKQSLDFFLKTNGVT